MADKQFFEGSLNPLNIFKSAAFDLRFMRDNPLYFDPCGIWVFCGAQGTGKTLSAVKTVEKLHELYPCAIICSNLELYNINDTKIIPFTDYSQIGALDNGIEGVIFLIDEIQVVWNSLESKQIPVSEMAEFAQNRKVRRVIIGTSQVFGRIAKPIREQLKYVIMCNNVFKYIQHNILADPNAEGYTTEDDGHLQAQIIKHFWWFHHPKDYQAYDTYNKIFKPLREKKKGGK